MVTKAVVLAAGLGTRLRPLTCAVPKPLLPVWGVPMLERMVARLRGWGVTDIVVNCHYLHEQVEAWCAANGCRASYEPEIFGTGGVLNPLRDWIGSNDFYLVNADVVVEGIDRNPFPPKAFVSPVPGADILGCCLMTEDGPRTIEAEPEASLITCWKSPDPGWIGTYTYCGLALLKAAILDYVEPTGFSSIVQAYERAMADGKFIRGIQPKNLLWTDAGTIPSYIEINRDGDENAFAALPQLAALAEVCPLDDVSFLGARGSDRCFFKAGNTIAVIYDDATRGENARYAGHARWLKAQGIPVPDVLADRPDLKALALEFVGATDLQHRIAEKGVSRLAVYAQVVETLAAFNGLLTAHDPAHPVPALEPAFDAALWRWEHDLFREHCLGTRFARELPPAVADELSVVAARLEQEPKALVHRDFQSTNVLWKNGKLSLIDFQGMREGPAAYDVVSLLYDPYVRLTDDERRALATLYGQKAGRPDIHDVLPFAAVQRLVQALGAYGRLASVGQAQFGRYVLPALENLLSAADEAGLEATGALAEDLIAREQHAADHTPHHHHHHSSCHCDTPTSSF